MPQVAKSMQEVMELHGELVTHYGGLHKDFLEDEKYANLAFGDDLGLPDEYSDDAVVLPTAIEIIDNAVNHVAPGLRRITVPRISTSARATTQSQTIKDFYGALLTAFERGAIENPFRQLIRHGATYGMMVAKEIYDPTMIPEEPIREAGEDDDEFKVREQDFKDAKQNLVPIRLEIPHPREILADPWSAPITFVIQVTSLKVAKAVSLFPDFERGSMRLTDSVDLIEYHDDTVRTLFVDTTPTTTAITSKNLMPVLAPSVINEMGFTKHGLGRLPYSIHSIGTGVKDSANDPRHQYIGALRHIKALLIAESKGYSIEEIVLEANAFPFRIAVGDNTDAMESFKFEPGMVKIMPSGVNIVDLKPLTTSGELRAHVFDASARLERSSLPRSLGGGKDPGVDSGFQQQLIQMQGQLRFQGLVEGFEHVLEDLCRIGAQIVERKIKGPIRLIKSATEDEFTDISASTFRGHRAVVIKVNAVDPEDEIRKHQDTVQMVTAGLWTREHGISKVSPEVEPRKMMGGILAEAILFSEPILGTLAQFFQQRLVQELSIEEIINDLLGSEEETTGTPTAEVNTFSERTPANIEGEAGGAGSRSDQAASRELALRETGR